MSEGEPTQFGCRALVGHRRRCGRQCWGGTAYCRLHYASLTWHMHCMLMDMSMGTDKVGMIGSPYRAPFDPEFAERWSPSPHGSTRVGAVLLALVVAGHAAYLVAVSVGRLPTPEHPWSWATILLWSVCGVCAWTMYQGNTALVFPRLLHVALGGLAALLAVEWTTGGSPSPELAFWRRLAVLAGFFLYAIPLLPGPLAMRDSDVTDRLATPPSNLGDGLLKGVGVLLLVLGGVLWLREKGLFAGLF